MKFVNIACIVIAMFCCHILAQAMTFDFNGTGFAIRNSSGSVANVTSIAPAGFHFDASLTYSAYPAMSGGGIQDGESMGWSAPNTGTGGIGGDIDYYRDVMPCARWKITINGQAFFVDLIDANWGLGDGVHPILLDFRGSSVDVYVETATNTSTQVGNPVNNGGEVLYWEAVRLSEGQNPTYVRDRTGHNNTYFTLSGGDIPLSGYPVETIVLDVNVHVTGSVTVPANYILGIEADPLFTPYTTSLKFDGSNTGVTVRGTLRTNREHQYPSGHGSTVFEPLNANPQRGDWYGITFDTLSVGGLNWTTLLYPTIGIVANCMKYNDDWDHVGVYGSSNAGLTLNNTEANFTYLHLYENLGCGLVVESDRFISYPKPTFRFSHIYNSGMFGALIMGTPIPEFNNSTIDHNGFDGIMFASGNNGIVDSCIIANNGQNSGGNWDGDGIHVFGSSALFTTVRYSNIYNNYYGINAEFAHVRAYDDNTNY